MTNVFNVEMNLTVIKAAVLGILVTNICGFCMLIHFQSRQYQAKETPIEATETVELSEYPIIDFAPCLEGDNPDVTEEDWVNSGCLKMQ